MIRRISGLMRYPDPHESGGEGVEELGVGGRVGIAEVIDRLDDPTPHQVGPDAVGRRAGEVGVVDGGQPVREVAPAVVVGVVPVERLAEGVRGLHLAEGRVGHLALVGEEDHLVVEPEPLPFEPHAREEGGQPVIVLLRHRLEGVVVALRALDADAQEELRRRLGRVFGRPRDPVEVGRGRVDRVPPAGQDLPRELVERPVVARTA